MSRDSRPPFGLDSLSALSKPSASSPKLFNSLLLGSSMAQSKPEGSSLRDLLNSGPGKLPQGPGESGVPFPSVFTSAGVGRKVFYQKVNRKIYWLLTGKLKTFKVKSVNTNILDKKTFYCKNCKNSMVSDNGIVFVSVTGVVKKQSIHFG